MAKPELGTKRQCLSCGAKFYDLNRDPIICPKCSTPFLVTAMKAAPLASRADDEEEVEGDAVDIVSLDDVAAQENVSETDGDDDDIDLGADLPDDDESTFLADDDEENDDVSDLIDSDIENDDEH